MQFKQKKLLIIGGAYQHCKLVEAAKEMGVITYVVDYLPVEKAPAKQIADFHYEYNITDYDDILRMCREEHIDGVLSSHLDACQIPYQVICERLNLPCFGSKEQYHILTDKTAFIQKCIELGVDVIPQYSENDFENEADCHAEFPVFVKPCDSRGSRGQTVCYSFSDVKDAISFAKSESKAGRVVIEKYMEGKQDFSMTYFVIEGKPHLIRLCDRYTGSKADGLDKLCQGCMSPSKHTETYIKYVDEKIKSFINGIGIKNGPVFMQGFVDGNTVRVYDPGLRFPGGEYERLLWATTGVSVSKALIEFALTGHIDTYKNIPEDSFYLNEAHAIQIDISLKPGVIKEIIGLDEIRKMPNVLAVAQRYYAGAEICSTHDVRQRLCEIAFIVPKGSDIEKSINDVVDKLHVIDTRNSNMLSSVLYGKDFI